MNTELEEARKAHIRAIYGDFPSLEADYALLEATQRAVNAQTVECTKCYGRGEYSVALPDMPFGWEKCPTCKGRGRVRKDGVL